MILITGSNGLVGSACHAYFSREHEVVCTSLSKAAQKNFLQCDLTDENQVENLFSRTNPDVVINCAAMKDVIVCEKEKEKCFAINVSAAAMLARLSKENKSFFIHFSTDYVFSGKKGMYREDDKPDPVLYYGKTKFQSEKAVAKFGAAICRTSGVYSFSSGATFVEFVVSELRKNKKLELFEDSFNSPTYVGNLCHMLEKIIENKQEGIMHTAGSERINRYNFGLRIAKSFSLDPGLIVPVKTPSEHELRPKDCSLDVSSTQKILKVPFFNVDEGLSRLKKDFKIA